MDGDQVEQETKMPCHDKHHSDELDDNVQVKAPHDCECESCPQFSGFIERGSKDLTSGSSPQFSFLFSFLSTDLNSIYTPPKLIS